MKYLLVLLLALILGAVAYRLVRVTPTAEEPRAGIAESARPRAEIPGQVEEQPVAASVPQRHPATLVSASPTTPAAGSGLLIPVQGKRAADLTDTFTDARSEGRSHDAIDIMAAAGTPVLAVADGQVEKLFDSQRGGLTIYQFEPSGKYAYYYAHLQRYEVGLAEKQQLKRGQVIGYVGSTGNASPQAPHLHFAIFLLGPERRWWEGTAVNPYPILVSGQ